jgi:hypothetical protein
MGLRHNKDYDYGIFKKIFSYFENLTVEMKEMEW